MAKTSPTKKRKASAKKVAKYDLGSDEAVAKADGGQVINLPEDEAPDPLAEQGITINAETGAVQIEHSDGSVTIDPTGESLNEPALGAPEDTDHYDNLADYIDSMQRSRIVEHLMEQIDNAKQERRQWEQMRAKSIEMLGMKLEDPKADVSTSALGMSTSVVRDPVLLEAVENARATSYGELCPAAGPVKVQNSGKSTKVTDQLAKDLEDDLNYYLSPGGPAKEYYPDTRYMLWWTALASGTFKKVYACPKRQRPVSEYVDGMNLIVPSNATDLQNAGLIAHESRMRPSLMKWMQKKGFYRDVTLGEPLMPQVNPVQQKIANVEGIQAQSQGIEEQDYTIYECCCELDIPGFEHPDGLDRPYKVTFEEGSREILSVVRNWEEDDPNENAQIPYVLFPFSTGISRIYGSGLGQMGGNLAAALTALMRITIDSGMMSVYPGLLKAKGTGRQLVNEIRVPPGGMAELDTGGLPIQQSVMGMPYTPPSPVIIQFAQQMRELAQRVLGSANIPVGEGTADVPVGTIIAQVEQATKVIGAVHKALHAAQDEELQLLRKLFKQDPAALWRGDTRGRNWALGQDEEERKQKFLLALDNCLLRPRSDPNIPSQMHRMLLASWLIQIANAPIVPGSPINAIEAYKRAASMLGIDDFDSLLNPPAPQGPPPPDPKALAAMVTAQSRMLDSQTKQGQLQLTAHNSQADRDLKENLEAMKLAHQATASDKSPANDPNQRALLNLKQQQLDQSGQKMVLDAHNAQADREARMSVEAMKIAQTVGVHPEADGIVDQQLREMSPYLTPAAQGKTPMAKGGEVKGEDAKPDVELYKRALEDVARALVQIYEQQNEKSEHPEEPEELSTGGRPSREPMPFDGQIAKANYDGYQPNPDRYRMEPPPPSPQQEMDYFDRRMQGLPPRDPIPAPWPARGHLIAGEE